MIFITYGYLRAYLKSVAKKLADDVDTLKNTAGTMGKVSLRCITCMYL